MVVDKLSNILTMASNSIGYSALKVIKSNRPDLCDYQCDEVFKLAKIYHKNPILIGEEIVNKINELDNFSDYFKEV